MNAALLLAASVMAAEPAAACATLSSCIVKAQVAATPCTEAARKATRALVCEMIETRPEGIRYSDILASVQTRNPSDCSDREAESMVYGEVVTQLRLNALSSSERQFVQRDGVITPGRNSDRIKCPR